MIEQVGTLVGGPPDPGPAQVVPWLYVSHLDHSLAFYRDVLGFSLRGSRSEEKSAYIDYHGARLMLQEPSGEALLVGELERPYGRGVHFLLRTRNVDELHAAVKAKAGEEVIIVQPRNRWYRLGEDMEGHREVVVRDPDGYLIRFYQPLEGLEDA